MRNNNDIVSKNIVCSVLLQVVTIISGFIIPKVILTYFGSGVNGLISSITQFLNYIQLLEGGLSSVIMAALYKPLSEGDERKVSGIVKATKKFFKRIGLIYTVYSIIVAIIYPLAVKTELNYRYVFSLVLVLAINLFVQYFFSLPYKLLLNADRNVYYVSLTQTIIIAINIVVVMTTARLFRDVLVVKLFSSIIFIIQPIMYNIFVKRHYHLDFSVEEDKDAISQRWDGFGINLAYFIHSNTDVIILTVLSSLENVSIYAVYLMIISAIKSLVISVSQAVMSSFGKILSIGDNQTIKKSFDLYEFGLSIITTFLFSCGLLLVTPFVDVYTLEITDANYHQPIFGILLACAEFVYCLREPYVAAAYSAGHFKQVSKYAYIEAVSNILISLILVRKYGLIGVAIGTLLSMIYRLAAHIYYLKNNILYRPIKKAIRSIVIDVFEIVIIACIFSRYYTYCNSYLEWFILAIKTAAVAGSVIIIGAFVLNRAKLFSVLNRLKK